MTDDCGLPLSLTVSPSPLIALVGLDASGRHSHLWRAFSSPVVVSNQNPIPMGVSQERLPIRWLLLSDLTSIPPPKAKRSNYEWFIPKGILKTNWLNKHLNVLPAVAVIFMELDWSDPNWEEKKRECASRVQGVRSALQGRTTKLAVVLIQHETLATEFLAGTDGGPGAALAAEREAELCSALELSGRSLFVLPVIGKDGVAISDAQTLAGYVAKLEKKFYEPAQNYYYLEIRNVKSHRDSLNKTTHLYLFVRHQFKSGFLNELKRDPHSAYKHYQQAYNLLMEVRATDTNIVEVKTVAGFINYKICKLAFQLNLPRDAIAQFRKHMDIFKHKIGLDALAFEHVGWQAEQACTFADIFADATRHGQSAIQTQHPGLYYQQAAQFAISRRKISEDLCSDITTYPDPDPLANSDSLDFYGQRPWRPGKVSIEPPEMELERSGIQALLYREKDRRSKNSDTIVSLLAKAIEQYKNFRSPRSQSHLIVQMSEELMAGQKYLDALKLLKPTVDHYRNQGWSVLLHATLSLGLKCCYLIGSAEDYVRFGMELASKNAKGSLFEEEESIRIMTNILKVFGNSGLIPSAEPGLTSKAERAAVDEATKLWSKLVSEKSSCDIEVRLDYHVSRNSALKVLPIFDKKKLKADQKVRLVCFLKYDVPFKDNPDLALPIRGVQASICQYREKKVSEAPCAENKIVLDCVNQSNEIILLYPGKSVEFVFEFSPRDLDVGQKVVVDEAIVRLGFQDSNLPVTLVLGLFDTKDCLMTEELENNFFIRNHPKISTDEVDGMTNVDFSRSTLCFSNLDIEPRDPSLTMRIEHQGPILVNEWFVVTVYLDNKETCAASDVMVCATLTEATDLVVADTTRLTLDYRNVEPMTPVTPSEGSVDMSFSAQPVTAKLGEIGSMQQSSVSFYIKNTIASTTSVHFAVSYTVKDSEVEKSFKCLITDILKVESIEPFDLQQELISFPRQLSLDNAFSNEPFILVTELKSLSPHPIKVIDTKIKVKHPVQKIPGSNVPSQLSGCTLERYTIGNECFPLTINKEDLHKDLLDDDTLEEQDVTMGKYTIVWVRENYEKLGEKFASESDYELTSIKVRSSDIYATMVLGSSCALVRTPLPVCFTFYNRSSRLQEFVLNIEASEAFMYSGNKQYHFKLLPNGGKINVNYVFYPLLAGESVLLPKPKLTSVRVTANSTDDQISKTLERLLPSHITVLARKREKDVVDDSGSVFPKSSCTSREDQYQVTPTVILDNRSFA